MAVEKYRHEHEMANRHEDDVALDREGRIALPPSLRDQLGWAAGTGLSCIRLGDGVLLLPSGSDAADMVRQGAWSLDEPSLPLQDILDNLPNTRREIMIEAYGKDYVEDLERRYADILGSALNGSHDDKQP